MMKTKYDFSISQQVAETMSIEIVDSLGAPESFHLFIQAGLQTASWC